MAAPIIKTDVNLLSKVKSLGASFFQKFVTTKNMNKVIANMNNVGVVDMVVCVAADTTTDFTMLKVGDYTVSFELGAGNAAGFQGPMVTDGTNTEAGQAGSLYLVLRPS